MEMINQLFRRKKARKYRFTESRLRQRISHIFGDKIKHSPHYDDSFEDEESPLTRQTTLKSIVGKNSRRMRSITINTEKFSTPVKNKKESLHSFSKTVKHDNNISMSNIKENHSHSKFTATQYDGLNNFDHKVKRMGKDYSYEHYALGSKYHIVKNSKNLSVDFKGNFEIVPNILGNESNHIQSVEFKKQPERKVTQPLYSTMIKRRTLTGNFKLKMARLGRVYYQKLISSSLWENYIEM
jgi:hypothetical protein